MRYFQRQALDPAIQSELNAKTRKDWKKLTKDQRKEIVKQLIASQKALCCYCETKISSEEDEHHIEHFVERHDDKDKIFDYTNMLLSCQGSTNQVKNPSETLEEAILRKSNISCGHGKEKGRHKDDKIDKNLLLNPTNNIAPLFSYVDGISEPSPKCTALQVQQVKYTVSRLKLDAKRLENARINEIKAILKV